MRDAPAVKQEVFPDLASEHQHQLRAVARRLEARENVLEEIEAEKRSTGNCSTPKCPKKVGGLNVGLADFCPKVFDFVGCRTYRGRLSSDLRLGAGDAG